MKLSHTDWNKHTCPYHWPLAHIPAIAEPSIFPTDVCEFHMPITKPRLQKKHNIKSQVGTDIINYKSEIKG